MRDKVIADEKTDSASKHPLFEHTEYTVRE